MNRQFTRREFLKNTSRASALTVLSSAFPNIVNFFQERKRSKGEVLNIITDKIFHQMASCNEVTKLSFNIGDKKNALAGAKAMADFYDFLLEKTSPQELLEIQKSFDGDEIFLEKIRRLCVDMRNFTDYKVVVINQTRNGQSYPFFFGGKKVANNERQKGEEWVNPSENDRKLLAEALFLDARQRGEVSRVMETFNYTQYKVNPSIPSPFFGCTYVQSDGEIYTIIDVSKKSILATEKNELASAMMRNLYAKKYRELALDPGTFLEFEKISELVSNYFSMIAAFDSENTENVSHEMGVVLKSHWSNITYTDPKSYSLIQEEIRILGNIVGENTGKYSVAQAQKILTKLKSIDIETLKKIYVEKMQEAIRHLMFSFEESLKPPHIDRNPKPFKQ